MRADEPAAPVRPGPTHQLPVGPDVLTGYESAYRSCHLVHRVQERPWKGPSQASFLSYGSCSVHSCVRFLLLLMAEMEGWSHVLPLILSISFCPRTGPEPFLLPSLLCSGVSGQPLLHSALGWLPFPLLRVDLTSELPAAAVSSLQALQLP